MTTEAIISTVFRFVNFGVIVGFISYIFNRKMLPGFKEKILSKQKDHQDLNKQGQVLFGQQQDLEKEIDQQEMLGKNLYDQIIIWSSSFEQQLLNQTQEQKKRFEKAMQRVQEQSERVARSNVQSVIFLKALSGAQKDLVSRFDDEQVARQFMSSIIKKMSKGA